MPASQGPRAFAVDVAAVVGSFEVLAEQSLRWAREALRRLEAGAPGHCGYSLFAISKADLRRLRENQLAYVREMQNVITASKANECVGLFCSQLLDLGEPANNAFSEDEPTPQHRAQVRTRGAVRAAGDLAVSERPAPR